MTGVVARCSSPTPTSTTARSAEELAEIAWLFGQGSAAFRPAAQGRLPSHSSYGSSSRPSAKKMRLACEIFAAAHPEIECDGELHGDAASGRGHPPQLPG